MAGRVIVPPNGEEDFVALSTKSAKAHGKVYEKHILSYGDLLYPGVVGGKVHIDDKFADTLITNFSNKVCDIVQVPKADHANQHSEDPDRNIGQVIGLTKRDGKVYAQIDARDPEAVKKIDDKLYLGASAAMHVDYKDTKTGKRVGPTLLHVAVTNRPYVTGLEDFSELVSLSADGSDEAVVLSAAPTTQEDISHMDKDALIAALRDEHGIDVPDLQERASKAETAVTLSNSIRDELSGAGFITLSAGEDPSDEDLVSAIVGAKDQIVSLSNTLEAERKVAAKKAAESRVESLIRSGKILSKQKDAQVELLLSNSALFESLLPEKPLVVLSNDDPGAERGVETVDGSHEATVEAEVARITQSDAAKQYIHA